MTAAEHHACIDPRAALRLQPGWQLRSTRSCANSKLDSLAVTIKVIVDAGGGPAHPYAALPRIGRPASRLVAGKDSAAAVAPTRKIVGTIQVENGQVVRCFTRRPHGRQDKLWGTPEVHAVGTAQRSDPRLHHVVLEHEAQLVSARHKRYVAPTAQQRYLRRCICIGTWPRARNSPTPVGWC